MKSLNTFFLSAILLIFAINFMPSAHISAQSGFTGMWTLAIEDGSVGWLEVHNKNGYLDADLLWKGGSVVPVAHVYQVSDNQLVVTRTQEMMKGEDGRKHIVTQTFMIKKSGDKLKGVSMQPNRDGMEVTKEKFKGVKLPPVPPAPTLSTLKYGTPIELFNGKDLSGWRLINPEHKNGFKVEDGVLVNNPVHVEGQNVHYGNIRTDAEFEDLNLKLEVNVPEGNNSGVYLRGMYEIQVFDSYGKDLDSHNMGALYSRIKPTVAAEKPGGQWQSLDITLCDRHVTVILNGKTIIDNQPAYGPTGGAIISDVFKAGPIYLQGDHGKVSYRNMVLKPILK